MLMLRWLLLLLLRLRRRCLLLLLHRCGRQGQRRQCRRKLPDAALDGGGIDVWLAALEWMRCGVAWRRR
jgi:hypothetical protein